MARISPEIRPQGITYTVVGTLSIVTIVYVGTLSVCALLKITPPPDVIADLKDVGLVALGALGSLLAKTSSAQFAKDEADDSSSDATSTVTATATVTTPTITAPPTP